MTAIDHLAYPHIIDLIWDHMSYPALIAASQTCRAWRDRCAPVLAQHVSIRKAGGSGLECTLIVSSRDLQFPDLSVELARGTVRFWQLGMRSPLPLQRWYVIPAEDHSGPHAERSRWIGVFKHTRVVDWHGFRSLSFDHVGCLAVMIANRPPGAPEPVTRLFESFEAGETLGDTVDWAPNVIFCDVDASRGHDVPFRGHLDNMLRFEPTAMRAWKANRPKRNIVLNVQCASDPCDSLLAFERSPTVTERIWMSPKVEVHTIVMGTGARLAPERITSLIKGLNHSVTNMYGLDTLLPPGTSWDNLLLSVRRLVDIEDRTPANHPNFNNINFNFDGPGDYLCTAWQHTREKWARLRDYEARFPDGFLVHTVS